MTDLLAEYTQFAFSHIVHLAENIGGRGSCTSKEREAAEYVAGELSLLGVTPVERESFLAIPSTYLPFTLGFVAAIIGSIIALLARERIFLLVAACLNLLGAWAMLAETDFSNHWARWFIPKRQSQNITGQLPSPATIKNRVVLCAHLDTHRTPVFFSSPAWQSLFTYLLTLTFLSMVASTVTFGLGVALDWIELRWLSLIVLPIQTFAMIMCLHAEFTPFSPGANDDASGVGAALGLVRRLYSEPLKNTRVYLAFTGCEEVGSYGIQAYLDRHSLELGGHAIYIILDEVGRGLIKYLSADGLVRKHKTHPFALDLAREICSAHPEFGAVERIGAAYTDALSVTKRGLAALTICTEIDPESGDVSHWHQMSDTPDTLQTETLDRAHQFVWELLQKIDLLVSE